MSHAPEPWKYKAMAGGIEPNIGYIVDADGRYVLGACQCEGEEVYEVYSDDPDWQRIVACVNACAGIPNSVLENYSPPKEP